MQFKFLILCCFSGLASFAFPLEAAIAMLYQVQVALYLLLVLPYLDF